MTKTSRVDKALRVLLRKEIPDVVSSFESSSSQMGLVGDLRSVRKLRLHLHRDNREETEQKIL